MVEWADVVVAEATFPSTGMGIELQIAEQNDIPIIVCFKSSGEHQATPVSYLTPDGEVHSLQIGEGFVSLMALGLPSIFRVVSYSNDEQLFQKIGQAVEILSAPD
jgi:hypothetical protein